MRVPKEITKQIEIIGGIERVTGCIQKNLTLLLPNGDRGTAKLSSYPLPMNREINRLHLFNDRIFQKNTPSNRIEVLIDSQHASARSLSCGNTISAVIIEGKQVQLTVTGTAKPVRSSFT